MTYIEENHADLLSFESNECKSEIVGRWLQDAGADKMMSGAEGQGEMMEEDRVLLCQIIASGGRKYTAGNIDRSRYERLVDFGALTVNVVNVSDLEYEVTDQGRQAVL